MTAGMQYYMNKNTYSPFIIATTELILRAFLISTSIVIVVLVDLQSSYSYINIRVISTNSFGEFCFSCEGHSHSDRFVFVHLLHSKTGKKHTSWIWSTVYPINIQHVCESLKQAY